MTLMSGASVLQNAAKARITGGEAELTAYPTNWLNVTAGTAYLDAEYKSFPGATVFVPAPPAGNRTVFLDVPGRQMIRAPKWTFNLGAEATHQIEGGGKVVLNATYFHSSSFPFEPSGRLRQSPYARMRAPGLSDHTHASTVRSPAGRPAAPGSRSRS